MTPTKNESLPELVARWRAEAERIAPSGRYCTGAELSEALGYIACADELEAALTREAPTEAEPFAWAYEEKGGYRDEAWVERVTRGPLPCWETRNQIPLFATPPAPQRLAQGDGELPGMWSASDFTGGDPDERSHAERTQPPHHDRGEVEQRARELLTHEYSKANANGEHDPDRDEIAIRAITAALTEAKQQGPVEAVAEVVAVRDGGSVLWTDKRIPIGTKLYTAPQVEAKRQTGEGE